jgi:hypothetical protein
MLGALPDPLPACNHLEDAEEADAIDVELHARLAHLDHQIGWLIDRQIALLHGQIAVRQQLDRLAQILGSTNDVESAVVTPAARTWWRRLWVWWRW